MSITILHQPQNDLQITFNPGITTIQLCNDFAGEVLGDIAVKQVVLSICVLELSALDECSLEGGCYFFFFLNDIAQTDDIEANIHIVGVEREGVTAGPEGRVSH